MMTAAGVGDGSLAGVDATSEGWLSSGGTSVETGWPAAALNENLMRLYSGAHTSTWWLPGSTGMGLAHSRRGTDCPSRITSMPGSFSFEPMTIVQRGTLGS